MFLAFSPSRSLLAARAARDGATRQGWGLDLYYEYTKALLLGPSYHVQYRIRVLGGGVPHAITTQRPSAPACA